MSQCSSKWHIQLDLLFHSSFIIEYIIKYPIAFVDKWILQWPLKLSWKPIVARHVDLTNWILAIFMFIITCLYGGQAPYACQVLAWCYCLCGNFAFSWAFRLSDTLIFRVEEILHISCQPLRHWTSVNWLINRYIKRKHLYSLPYNTPETLLI